MIARNQRSVRTVSTRDDDAIPRKLFPVQYLPRSSKREKFETKMCVFRKRGGMIFKDDGINPPFTIHHQTFKKRSESD